MGEGDLKELRELIEFLKASGIAEFDMERPEMKVRLKFAEASETAARAAVPGVDLAALARLMSAGSMAAPAATVTAVPPEGLTPAVPSMAMPAAESPAAAVDEDAGLHIVKSPLVGAFYDAPSPGADPFVKVGDTVGDGDVLCIVEAMKIMNEIESDAGGQIVKVYVRPGQPVEYGQKLFGLRV